MARRAWYDVLDVGPAATAGEIRAAYLALVKAWHPDRFAGAPALAAHAEERLKEINAAYEEARAWDGFWEAAAESAPDAAWADEWSAVWSDASDPSPYRLLFTPNSLAVRAIALVLALLFTFFAVANTMNALSLSRPIMSARHSARRRQSARAAHPNTTSTVT